MEEQSLLDALAEGIRGELDSVTVYEEAATRSDGEVRAFFFERAEEEKQHYNWLLDYYQQISLGETPIGRPASRGEGPVEEDSLLTKEFLKQIGEKQYLSTAISTALLLEYNAMTHYKRSAETAQEPSVKELFEELFQWETDHYDALLKIQSESRQYWFDIQKFEPF